MNKTRISAVTTFQHGAGGSHQCNQSRKINKRHPIRKEDVNLLLFTDGVIIYRTLMPSKQTKKQSQKTTRTNK